MATETSNFAILGQSNFHSCPDQGGKVISCKLEHCAYKHVASPELVQEELMSDEEWAL